MRFRLLGATQLRASDHWVSLGSARTSALISALLLRANRTADAKWLMSVVWPDGQPASASANLRQYVAKVRQTLRQSSLEGIASLRSVPAGYRLEVERDEVDLSVFRRLTVLGQTALNSGDAVAARQYLADAVGLWRGELGEGLPPGPELEAERAYWQELRMLATQSLLAARIILGEHGEAAAELQRLITDHPLREELRGMLMVALYRSHRRSDALDVFQRARAMLVAEFGIEPGPFLQRLQQAILLDDPALVTGGIPEVAKGGDNAPKHTTPHGPVPRLPERHPPNRTARYPHSAASSRRRWPT